MIPGRELRSHMCCVCLVIQSCLTLCDPMDCSPPGSSVHGDSPGKNTGADSKPSSRRSSQPRDRTQVSHKAGGFFTKVPHAKEQLSPARNCGVHTPQQRLRASQRRSPVTQQRCCMLEIRPDAVQQINQLIDILEEKRKIEESFFKRDLLPNHGSHSVIKRKFSHSNI